MSLGKKTGHIRIINLFPSYYVFLIKSKNTKKKINRTSSDLMDDLKKSCYFFFFVIFLFYQKHITGWK